jgi:hypothetical protein
VKSPADRLVESLDGEYFKLTDVAIQLNVSESSLRRLRKREGLRAPSFEIRQGGMHIYLYTPDDVDELRNYYAKQVPVARIQYPAEKIAATHS